MEILGFYSVMLYGGGVGGVYVCVHVCVGGIVLNILSSVKVLSTKT